MNVKSNSLTKGGFLLGMILAVVSLIFLVLPCAKIYALDSGVKWTRVDGTDFVGNDIWFTEMFGATNGFPVANQIVGDDSVVGRALTLNKGSTAGRATGRVLTGVSNTGLYKLDFDVKLPSNFGAATRGAGVAFFDSRASLDTNVRRSDNKHVFRIFSIDAADGRDGGLYLDFKQNIANVVATDDSWQISAANLENTMAVTAIDPKFKPNLWINVSAMLDYCSNTAVVTLTILEGVDSGYSRSFATDLPGEDRGIGVMAVCGMTLGGGSSWTAKIANINIYTGVGQLANLGRIRIDEQPVNLVAIPGRMDANTRISVTATGIGVDLPLSYQWFYANDASGTGGVKIDGATDSSYIIPEDMKPGSYYFYSQISAIGADPVTTNTVTVTVRHPVEHKEWGIHYPNQLSYGFQRAIFMENNPQMYFNEELKPVFTEDSAVTPLLANSTLLIPYETATASFGSDVLWDLSSDSNTITVSRGNRKAVLTVGSGTMAVDSESVTLMASAMMVDGVLYVPAEAIAAALGLSTGWDAESGVLVITSGVPVFSGPIFHSRMNNQAIAWYGSNESIRLANNLLLYQRNSGGWVENIDMGVQMTEALKQQLLRQKNNNDASLDNGVTVPELRYLISMYQATKIERYREAYIKAINGILAAQYKNGGLPQRMNQPSSYHGEITFNDNAMTQVLRLWWDIYSNPNMYYSIDAATFEKIEDSLIRGIDCILDTQIYSEQQGMLTAWCAQHDRNTLQPTWGRDYEPPSISGSESIGVINFLMGLDREFLINLDKDNTLAEELTIWERVQTAIHSAVVFFDHVEIFGYNLVSRSSPWGSDRTLVENEKGRGIWARFICIDTFEPLMFDRRSPTFRSNPREVDTYRPIITGALPGKHYASGGNLRNLYRDAEGNLHPIIVGSNGALIRPEGTVMDLAASYANLSHERRNGYQFVGTYGTNLSASYNAWLQRNNLSSQL